MRFIVGICIENLLQRISIHDRCSINEHLFSSSQIVATFYNRDTFLFQAYISCALGVHRVGYVMICFGVVNAICSLVFGSLMKFVGRQPLMVLGAIVHVSLIVVLLHWKPNPDNPYVFYSVSGLWGVGDAVWQTQVNGTYCELVYYIF